MTQKVLAIVGATASGKTGLAVELAKSIGGLEAINADSRQVYRYMDIGTAKPTSGEREALPHWLVDVVYPDQQFNLGRWLELAKEGLETIWGRGLIPVIVGGTGQYVWALLEGWRVPQVPSQEELRREMESRPPDDLLSELLHIDPASEEYIQPSNVRRVIRALEVYHATGKPFTYWRTKDAPDFDAMVVGLHLTRDALYKRIDQRVDMMMRAGFLGEVRGLVERGYGCDLPAMSAMGYRELCEHLHGELTLEEAVERTKTGTHRLARHQNAWFKASDRRIHWLESDRAVDGGIELVREWLA
ncbi:MAG TPA: tRNA (adenosine(37)-N6)-dimethylallyltransferase MiaA [Dehalococcoidia bacterium]|nr:tRNA (adenosine(37)-N6)-dimethylallyltransferase MiaA [Dehalococcoidia bacterium]